MKKRVWAVAAAAVLLVAVAACGNKGKENGDNGQNAGGENAGSIEYAQDISTADLESKAAEALGDDYWPDSDIPAEILEETYGLPAGLYEEVTAKMPMISINVDTLIIVKAVQGQEDAVKEALEGYRNNAVKDSLQYPMNVGKVQASTVKRFGSYVCFVQLGGAAVDEETDEAVIKGCKEANETVLTVIETALLR